jgi:transcriptional regulator with XRE-family HTH domain
MYGSKKQTETIRALRKLGGRWLKEQRETVGLSQRELAKEVGLSYYTFVSQVESGTARIPPEHYEIWSIALKIPVAEFVRAMLKYYDPIIFDLLFPADVLQVPHDERKVA